MEVMTTMQRVVFYGGSLGTNRLHTEFESKVAAFLGKEAALVTGMGFATNSNTQQKQSLCFVPMLAFELYNITNMFLFGMKPSCRYFPGCFGYD